MSGNRAFSFPMGLIWGKGSLGIPSGRFPPSSHKGSLFPALPHKVPKPMATLCLLLPTALCPAPGRGPYLGGSLYSQRRQGL